MYPYTLLPLSSQGFVLNGRVVMNPTKIKDRYLDTWFPLDLIASLPLDFCQFIYGYPMPIFRINKILRLLHFKATMEDLESKPGVNITLVR